MIPNNMFPLLTPWQWLCVLFLALTACGAGQDDDTPKFNCTAGLHFSEGSKVWLCSYEGHDAELVGDCAELVADPTVTAKVTECGPGTKPTGSAPVRGFVCCVAAQ